MTRIKMFRPLKNDLTDNRILSAHLSQKTYYGKSKIPRQETVYGSIGMLVPFKKA